MPFGEVQDAIFKKLDRWLQDPPDYHDVEQAYKERGKLQSEKIAITRAIESIEEDIVSDEENKPRANNTRIKKIQATKQKRECLAHIEQQIAENDALCKWLEFKKSMFSAAMYRVKMQMDM